MNKKRLVGLMAVLCLVTTCLMAGTLAKYTTTVAGDATSKVAKFNVAIKSGDTTFTGTSNTFNLFDTSSDTGVYSDASTKNLIAPGTGGSLGFDIVSTSQVKVQPTFKMSFDTASKTALNSLPIVIKNDGKYYSNYFTGTVSLKKHESGSAEEITIADTIDSLGETPNSLSVMAATDGTSANAITVTPSIEWFWAFEGDGSTQTDAKDTALGTAGTPATLNCTITVTATQVDE